MDSAEWVAASKELIESVESEPAAKVNLRATLERFGLTSISLLVEDFNRLISSSDEERRLFFVDPRWSKVGATPAEKTEPHSTTVHLSVSPPDAPDGIFFLCSIGGKQYLFPQFSIPREYWTAQRLAFLVQATTPSDRVIHEKVTELIKPALCRSAGVHGWLISSPGELTAEHTGKLTTKTTRQRSTLNPEKLASEYNTENQKSESDLESWFDKQPGVLNATPDDRPTGRVCIELIHDGPYRLIVEGDEGLLFPPNRVDRYAMQVLRTGFEVKDTALMLQVTKVMDHLMKPALCKLDGNTWFVVKKGVCAVAPPSDESEPPER